MMERPQVRRLCQQFTMAFDMTRSIDAKTKPALTQVRVQHDRGAELMRRDCA